MKRCGYEIVVGRYLHDGRGFLTNRSVQAEAESWRVNSVHLKCWKGPEYPVLLQRSRNNLRERVRVPRADPSRQQLAGAVDRVDR
jgi:hypothetical protein